MAEPPDHLVTRLLVAVGRGEADARPRLFAAVYDELRRMAAAQMAIERGPRTLQPTALVHEAYLRLIDGRPADFHSRGHFFNAAAEAMRRILVESARMKGRHKRGDGKRAQTLAADPPGDGDGDYDPGELLSVDEMLDALSAEHPRQAEVVKHRYFMGLTIDETAEVLGVCPRTVDNDWQFARAWLLNRLRD